MLELDAASRTGVDAMRDLLESVRYAPVEARYKVYVIDEVHMLSTGAFNALLKTLEEPPPHAKFIFATTEIRKVPVTILSRCQRFDLRRVEPEILSPHLEKICALEGVKIDADAVALIARAAEGSVRDGLSLLDQALVQGEPGEIVGPEHRPRHAGPGRPRRHHGAVRKHHFRPDEGGLAGLPHPLRLRAPIRRRSWATC